MEHIMAVFSAIADIEKAAGRFEQTVLVEDVFRD
jgi:hypothetical protein